jgi:osmotically inducible protein OsmC
MNPPEKILRSATVHWEGDVARGRGTIATESGKVQADYSFGTRFSGDPGTNPEELLGAAHAACFTMALSAVLTRAGHPPTSLDSKALVHLDKDGPGYSISAIELATNGVVPGISEADFQKYAAAAKDACPLSKALKAVPVSLKATLGA